MNSFNVGDFITTSRSKKPSFIISKIKNELLVSIHEYNGDYLWININNSVRVNLTLDRELSILGNFGSWFYDQHKLLYQEKIILLITNLFKL